jgi:hypothetical protein
MKTNDSKLLLIIEDRLIAQDIQSLLEEHEIYTLLESDNPASSVISTYGLNPMENIEIKINALDYQRAVEILAETPYKELIK